MQTAKWNYDNWKWLHD